MNQQTSRAAVIERITRLMALSDSPHEAEAALAAERATKLMLQWVIDEAELNGATKQEAPESVQVELPGDKGGLFEMYLLLQALAKAHGCLTFFHRDLYSRRGSRAITRSATLAGFAAEVAAVQQLFAMLAAVMAADMRRDWRGAHAHAEARMKADRAARGLDTNVRLTTHGHAAYRRGFYQGFVTRVAARLDAARAEVEEAQDGTSNALVLAARQERVSAWVDGNMETYTERIRTAQMSQAGWDAGAASGERAPLGRTGLPKG
ncbi:MAG: DUF2786 domain-containing protein [Bifidobacteriaceae bacterium]|jgi:hypothetical protein|nr:DUF2786 domain-containing protein [Bifidobacteriaceae bacterium]